MVGHLAGGRPLPGEVVDHIVTKAAGQLAALTVGARLAVADG